MKHFTEGGARVWKVVTVRIFNPGNASHRTIRRRADKGQGFADAAVDDILDGVAEHLEKYFPEHDYRLVPIGSGEFNFVWRGRRQAPGTQEQVGA